MCHKTMILHQHIVINVRTIVLAEMLCRMSLTCLDLIIKFVVIGQGLIVAVIGKIKLNYLHVSQCPHSTMQRLNSAVASI